MAVRRGSFSFVPRTAPNLSSTIIAIAREMQAAQARNLMDAWQNGGTYNGQLATDEVVLAYWRGRLDGIDPDDPLYEEYKNTILQYEYAIGESKAATAYAQGRFSDAGMAQFYLGWAKKVPPNSEFYRTLQRDAAQFMRAARARGAASVAKVREATYQEAKGNIIADYEAVGAYLTDVVANMLRTRFPIGELPEGVDKVFRAADPSAALDLLERINDIQYTSPIGGDEERVAVRGSAILYNDPFTGLPVTALDVQTRLRQLDPNYSGMVTADYFASTLRAQMTGQTQRYELAVAAGKKGEANSALSQRVDTSEIGRQVGAWPTERSYMDIRDNFLATWSGLYSPNEKLAAFEEYQRGLIGLANDTKRPVDASVRTLLLAEATGDTTVDTLAETFIGTTAGEHATLAGTGVTQGDSAETWADVQRFLEMDRQVASGEAEWTMGVTKGGVFVPSPGGVEIGAAAPSVSGMASRIFLPQSGTLPHLPVTIEGRPVRARTVDINGNTVDALTPNSQTIGMVYDTVYAGQQVRLYGRQVNGVPVFSLDNPWNPSASQSETAGGGLLLTAVLPIDVNDPKTWPVAAPDSPYVIDPPSTTTGQSSISVDPGAALLLPERANAGIDPLTDSTSLSVALYLQVPDGGEMLTDLSRDPRFQWQIENEARSAALQQYDPLTNTWTGGDMALGDANLQRTQLQVLQNIPVFDESRRIGLWGTPPRSGTGGQSPDERGMLVDRGRSIARSRSIDRNMPADRVAGTNFEALGRVFVPGSAQFASRPDATGGFMLRTEGTLTVPAVPKPADLVVTPKSIDIQVTPESVPSVNIPAPVKPVTTLTPAPTPTRPLRAQRRNLL